MEFTYAAAKDAAWQNKAMTKMVIWVDWDHIPEDTFSPCGIEDFNGVEGEEHLADLWNRAIAGDFGTVTAYETPADLTTDETCDYFGIREIRDRLLLQSDIAITNDRWQTMTDEQKQAWTVYRQALRDVPQNFTLRGTYDDDEEVYKLPSEYSFPEAPR